jgi:hypothetical protein
MLPHQQRVVDEKSDLDAKLQRLKAFWDSPIFPTLPDAEKERLERQSNIMDEYSRVLGERIAAF